MTVTQKYTHVLVVSESTFSFSLNVHIFAKTFASYNNVLFPTQFVRLRGAVGVPEKTAILQYYDTGFDGELVRFIFFLALV